MITDITRLYAATNDGLEIIALHYPEAREAARTGKPFKMRHSDRAPSASVRLYDDKRGFKVWKVTDFGGDQRATDPIQVHADATGLSFKEALQDLSETFMKEGGAL